MRWLSYYREAPKNIQDWLFYKFKNQNKLSINDKVSWIIEDSNVNENLKTFFNDSLWLNFSFTNSSLWHSDINTWLVLKKGVTLWNILLKIFSDTRFININYLWNRYSLWWMQFCLKAWENDLKISYYISNFSQQDLDKFKEIIKEIILPMCDKY